MSKQFRIIDAANFLTENYSEQQIEEMKRFNIINSRILLAMEANKVFKQQKSKSICDRYEHTAMAMRISVSYVRKLLNE